MTVREKRILLDVEGRVAHITINRPHVLNAMDRQSHVELSEAIDAFEADDNLRVAVITGAGDRAFCVGQDLKELADRERLGESRSSVGSKGLPGWPRLTERADLRKPLIAKVNGYALGGGFEIALCCDLIVAADHAVFGLPEAKLGLVPGAGGVFRLGRLIPPKIAMEYLLTGRHMAAKRAYSLGLVNHVADAADLDDVTRMLTDEIVGSAPLSVRSIKRLANDTAAMSLGDAFAYRCREEEERRVSEDAREGVMAFNEKRQPAWKGR